MRSVLATTATLVLAACAAPAGDSRGTSTAAGADAKRTACVATPMQLAAKDIKAGEGDPIPAGTAVLVNYTGWLFESCAPEQKGKMFDSSKNRSTPFGFMVGAGRVIKGWDEGLVGMREGGQRLLWIPADKAYGEKGTPDGSIPPNSALVFEVELVKVIYRPGAPTSAPPAAAK